MAEVLPIHQRESGTQNAPSRFSCPVSFERAELNQILSVYSRHVIAGDWCDYALNDGPREAVFSIYKKRSQVPVFRVVKRRAGRGRYAVLDAGGQVLRMSGDLSTVLPAIDRRPKLRLV